MNKYKVCGTKDQDRLNMARPLCFRCSCTNFEWVNCIGMTLDNPSSSGAAKQTAEYHIMQFYLAVLRIRLQANAQRNTFLHRYMKYGHQMILRTY